MFQASEEDMESRGGGTSNTFEFIPPKPISELAEQFSVRNHVLVTSVLPSTEIIYTMRYAFFRVCNLLESDPCMRRA